MDSDSVFLVCIVLLIVLFAGEPDLMDAIVSSMACK